MAKAKAKSKRKPLTKPDPIFEAMANARRLEDIWNRLYDQLNHTEHRLQKKHGRRPWSLIAWRNYSAIGGGEIETARTRFLHEKIAPRRVIQTEYLAAKARERAGERAEKAWDRRVGITAQRRECDNAIEADRAAHLKMAKTRPTTPAGAAAMLAFVKADLESGEVDWHDIALGTLVATLKARGKAVQR